MGYADKKEGATLTLVQAVETLSHIAEMQLDKNMGIAQEHTITLDEKPITYRTVHWLHKKDSGSTVNIVKEIFRVILHYLKNFYKNDYNAIQDQHTLDGIKTIMVLVGEAAKKLDRYTALFHSTQNKSVTELKEYKQLQEFYHNRIARKIDDGALGKWILALSQKVKTSQEEAKERTILGRKKDQAKHIFIDLESVKKDSEYELFSLRKEDGTRFFSPRLIRNIKLVSDFGDYFGEEKLGDPLINIDVWQDRLTHHYAKNIIRASRNQIHGFYREAWTARDLDLVGVLNKAIMALLLTANPQNLSHNVPIKSCKDYFYDFQLFLADALNSRDYQKVLTNTFEKPNKIIHSVISLLHDLCATIFTKLDNFQDLVPLVHGLIQNAKTEFTDENSRVKTLSGRLENEYILLSKQLKLHPNGPLNKILETLEGGSYREFNPYMQDNLPMQLFTTYLNDNACYYMRLPSPTKQDFIHKAALIDEFKGFLRACENDDNKKCLLINMQDRLTWREHARCSVVEEVPNIDAFGKNLEVVTMTKDTEFYHQLAPYHTDNDADAFIKSFQEQLESENCGFLFPESMRKAILVDFAPGVMKAIHRIFFNEKNRLLREHRLDFIEMFYLLLQLKVIELSKASFIGFTCKDSIDIAGTAVAQLFIFLKSLAQERLSESDQEHLDAILYGPALIIRERLVLTDRFHRMTSAIKLIEAVQQQFGQVNYAKVMQEAFGHFFKTPVFQTKTIIHRSNP